MRNEFGEDSEILVFHDSCGIAVRLQVFKFREWHHQQFIISHAELESDVAAIGNIKWVRAITELRRYLEKYQPPPK